MHVLPRESAIGIRISTYVFLLSLFSLTKLNPQD
jgi:hypothetical protein